MSVVAAPSSFSGQLLSRLGLEIGVPLPATETKTRGSVDALPRLNSARIHRFEHDCRESAWSSIHVHVRYDVQREQ